jgi:hypothetical protein
MKDYRVAEAVSGKTMFLASAYPEGMLHDAGNGCDAAGKEGSAIAS